MAHEVHREPRSHDREPAATPRRNSPARHCSHLAPFHVQGDVASQASWRRMSLSACPRDHPPSGTCGVGDCGNFFSLSVAMCHVIPVELRPGRGARANPYHPSEPLSSCFGTHVPHDDEAGRIESGPGVMSPPLERTENSEATSPTNDQRRCHNRWEIRVWECRRGYPAGGAHVHLPAGRQSAGARQR